MWNMIDSYRSRVSQFFNPPPITLLATDVNIHEVGNLSVTVSTKPLGSYGENSEAGTVTIRHKQHKGFHEWSHNDLFHLAHLEQMFLLFNERVKVSNNLILGRQEGTGEFKVTIVPYQACTLMEKIKVFIRVFFETWIKLISTKQANKTAEFYQKSLLDTGFAIHPMPPQNKPDAFCRPDVIREQEIHTFTGYNSYNRLNYHLLHDKWPKGTPHFLIVPDEEHGHFDGSNFDPTKRFHMLKIAQQAARFTLEKNTLEKKPNSTLFVVERNGEQLQSVQHKHKHVISSDYPLNSLWGKIRTVVSLCLAPFRAVSPSDYAHYKNLNWTSFIDLNEGKGY